MNDPAVDGVGAVMAMVPSPNVADALDHGKIANGDLVLLVGFGGGMTAASCVLRWGGDLDG